MRVCLTSTSATSRSKLKPAHVIFVCGSAPDCPALYESSITKPAQCKVRIRIVRVPHFIGNVSQANVLNFQCHLPGVIQDLFSVHFLPIGKKINQPFLRAARWYTGKKIRQIWAEWAVCVNSYLKKGVNFFSNR